MSYPAPTPRASAAGPIPRKRPAGRTAEQLREAIEGELLPRMLLATQVGPLPPEVGFRIGEALDEAAVEEFVRRLRDPQEDGAGRLVDDILDGGIPVEAVYLDLLAPTAHRFGEMWESDECDFVEVTLALGRMQRILRDLSRLFLYDGAQDDAERPGRVLLAAGDGEQHTLGLLLVAEFFVRDGWFVDVGPPLAAADLGRKVRDEWFDVVGFSVSCDSRVPTLRRSVGMVRRASQNPDVRVLVGGCALGRDPDLVGRIGADGSATDAPEALQLARSLLHPGSDHVSDAVPD